MLERGACALGGIEYRVYISTLRIRHAPQVKGGMPRVACGRSGGLQPRRALEKALRD